jgi:16S rRNA (cytosine1402-N4)-methyltransferase
MTAMTGLAAAEARHVPVLLDPILSLSSPITGTWIDGTLGAGGYTRALLDAGALKVIGIDRDPDAVRSAADWSAVYGSRLTVNLGRFAEMEGFAGPAGSIDGIVLDIGVSSMQLDQAERGFSFRQDGPLDMRMGQEGPGAADLLARADERELADILHYYGEEHAARRIARRLVEARSRAPVRRTLELARLVESCLPRPKPGQPHPATRTFQALRIAINDELGELVRGLGAAERLLRSGGLLVVVTFHSLEDRIVKRFLKLRSGGMDRGSRFAPERSGPLPGFDLVTRRPVSPTAEEIGRNPRARSAHLRIARRLASTAVPVDPADLGLPVLRGTA